MKRSTFSKKKPDETLTKLQKEEKERKAKIKSLDDMCKNMVARRRAFIVEFINNKGKIERPEEFIHSCFKIFLERNSYNIKENMANIMLGNDPGWISQEEINKIKDLRAEYLSLLMAEASLQNCNVTHDYYAKYKNDQAKIIKSYINLIKKPLKYDLTEEEQQLLDGTHELYVK